MQRRCFVARQENSRRTASAAFASTSPPTEQPRSGKPSHLDCRIAIGQFGKFLQLLRGELGLIWTATADNLDFPDAALGKRIERVRGNIRVTQFVCCLRQYSGDIERHISVTDDDGPLAAEVEAMIPKFRMSVVPGDEIGGLIASRQGLAGNIHWPADRGAGGQDDGVIAGEQQID